LKLGCAAQALAPTAVIISPGQHGRARWPLGTERLVENCLSLLSLFVFGVTLETLNDPKELSAITFKPWDFLTYGLIALGILLLIRIVRKPDSRKT
jgi:hypothetical protein